MKPRDFGIPWIAAGFEPLLSRSRRPIPDCVFLFLPFIAVSLHLWPPTYAESVDIVE